MSIYKRGGICWCKFMWNGELIRESTKQANDKKARNIESAHRTALANGLVGIREKKQAPTLKGFCDDRFEPWAKASFEKNAVNNWVLVPDWDPRAALLQTVGKCQAGYDHERTHSRICGASHVKQHAG